MNRITRITAVLLAVMMAALAFASCSKDTSAPKGMIKASNEKADFTMYIPEKWTVDTADAAVSAYCSKNDPSSVSMMAWGLEYTDSALDDWWEVNLEEIGKVFSDVEITAEEDAIVDGLYTKKYTYTATLAGNSYKIMQAACIKDSNVYLLTYTSTPETFETHTEDVNSILTNLKIGR